MNILPSIKQGKTTHLKRKPWDKKVKSNKGFHRSCRLAGNNALLAFSSLLMITDELGKLGEDEYKKLQLNLMANNKGKLLMAREIVHQVEKQAPFRQGAKFNAGKQLKSWLESDVLRSYSKYNRKKQVAREAEVLPLKIRSLSEVIIENVKWVLEEDFIDQLDLLEETYVSLPELDWGFKSEWENRNSQRYYEINQLAISQMTQLMSFQTYLKDIYKKKQKNGGKVTLALINKVVNDFFPGHQPERKKKVILTLQLHYKLITSKQYKIAVNGIIPDPWLDDTSEGDNLYTSTSSMDLDRLHNISSSEYQVWLEEQYSNTKILALPPASSPSTQEVEDNITITLEKQDGEDDIIGSGNNNIKEDNKVREDNKGRKNFFPTYRSPFSSLTSVTPSVSPSVSPSVLRDAALSHLSDDLPSHVFFFNEAIRHRLITYMPKDELDLRQMSSMLNGADGPLPCVYKTLSSVSPRVYSESSDNLFSCRKDMRLHALRGLGLFDVDLTSCHSYVLIGKWSTHFPLLREHLIKGSIWSLYEDHFSQHGLAFHKKLVKPLHYASLLGGGMNAFYKAIHRFNIDNPSLALDKKAGEHYISVFKKGPLYKEFRSFLTWLSKKWSGKHIEVLTGERFTVEPFRRYKDGSTSGNLLTVLSAYLQSVEVTLISYLILRCYPYFTPLLWQHDGLTVKFYDDQGPLVFQQAIDEICQVLLPDGLTIPLQFDFLG